MINSIWPIWPFFLLLQISPPTLVATSSPHPLASFLSHGRMNDWLRLPKEGKSGGEWLILGAVNRLYVLDAANLSLAHETVTGPVLDSPFCNAELTSCIGPRERSIVEMDNWNKLLIPLLNRESSYTDALLICGSTRQGECQLRQFPSLERIQRHSSLSGHWQHIPVVANGPEEATTSALLAGDRLFVAATSSNEESPYRETFPAVATRLLSDGLQPVHAGSLDGEAAVHIRAEFRPRLRVRYLHSFRDQSYVYWLAVQPKSAHSNAPLVTRLIRVCLDDDRYTSYSELELQCRSGEDNALFGVAKAAAQIQGDELWAVFTDLEGRRSAICAFTLAKLRLTFWYNIDRCRGGTDTIGLPHIGRDAKCTNRSHLPLSEDTCALGVGSSIEASAPALAIFDEQITALDVAEMDGHLLMAAGTQSGQVMQMEAIGKDRANRRLQKYAQFRVAADPIQRIAILQKQQKLLVAADKEVKQFDGDFIKEIALISRGRGPN